MDHSSKLINVLNELISLDFDAAQAYKAAVVRLKDRISKKMMASFRADHMRHTRSLAPEVRRLGGKPTRGPDLKSMMTGGLVVLAKLAGDKMILRALKMNEDLTNKAYEKARNLKSPTLKLQALLKSHLGDERRHRAWIVRRIKEMSRKGAA
jgi:hypothetical protein